VSDETSFKSGSVLNSARLSFVGASRTIIASPLIDKYDLSAVQFRSVAKMTYRIASEVFEDACESFRKTLSEDQRRAFKSYPMASN